MGLTGTIPSQMSNIAEIYLNSNNLSGVIPFLNNTKILDLKDNSFTQFPTLWNALEYLDLTGNALSGTIPPSNSAPASNLRTLKVPRNRFVGPPPDWIKTLSFLDVSINRLTNLSNQTFPGIVIRYPQDVDECAMNTHDCTGACVDGWNPPLSYTCGCDEGETLDTDQRTCIECLGELVPVPVNTPQIEFPSINDLGYNDTLLDFQSCSSCSYGRRFFTRHIVFNPNCQAYADQSNSYQNCEYACSNLSDPTMAKESIRTLVREFQKGKFLQDVISTFFGLDVTFGDGKKRFLGLSFLDWFLVSDQFYITFNPRNSTWITNTTNFEKIRVLIEHMCYDCVPFIPALTVTILRRTNNNVMEIRAQDPDSTTPVVLGIVISSFWTLCCLGCCAFGLYKRALWDSSPIRRLPAEVSWSFQKYEKNKDKWEFRGTKTNRYYFKEFALDSKHGLRVLNFFKTYLGGDDLKVNKIEAVYNELLTGNFVNMKSFFEQRLTKAPTLFANDTTGGDNQRQWVLDKYNQFALQFRWNRTPDGALKKVAIIPAIHGTDMATARAIAETGFAAVSLLDAGYFGKGIYFTTFANYTIPYFSTRREPTIIFSWIVCGSIYPVIEAHSGPNSLKGTAIQGRTNSHFVVTNRHGECIQDTRTDERECFNEIVVGQESQIVPAFLLAVSQDNIGLLLRKWKRNIPDDEKFFHSTSESTSQMVSEDSLLASN